MHNLVLSRLLMKYSTASNTYKSWKKCLELVMFFILQVGQALEGTLIVELM